MIIRTRSLVSYISRHKDVNKLYLFHFNYKGTKMNRKSNQSEGDQKVSKINDLNNYLLNLTYLNERLSVKPGLTGA